MAKAFLCVDFFSFFHLFKFNLNKEHS